MLRVRAILSATGARIHSEPAVTAWVFEVFAVQRSKLVNEMAAVRKKSTAKAAPKAKAQPKVKAKAKAAAPQGRGAKAAIQMPVSRAGKSNIHVGIGGWTYEPWRGLFYPPGLSQSR